MSSDTDTAAPRSAELDIDRARRRSQTFLAFDLLAEPHGQAEWQRFRRKDPMAFLRAKLDVQGGPPGLRLSVDWRHHDRQEVLCLFEWPVIGSLEHRACQISYHSLIQDEDDRFLAATARWIARDIEIAAGAVFRILVRGNRAAWEWHEDHKYDQPQEAPKALPRRKRVAGEFCGTCRARFRTEQLSGEFAAVLPCGHYAAGEWTEYEP